MVKLHCDRCGKEIREKHYYTINICKEDINQKNTLADYAEALKSMSSSLPESLYAKLNAKKMYCEKCKDNIEAFINGNDAVPWI